MQFFGLHYMAGHEHICSFSCYCPFISLRSLQSETIIASANIALAHTWLTKRVSRVALDEKCSKFAKKVGTGCRFITWQAEEQSDVIRRHHLGLRACVANNDNTAVVLSLTGVTKARKRSCEYSLRQHLTHAVIASHNQRR